MTGGKRIALLAAVVVIAVVGFIIIKPDEGSEEQSSVPSTVTTPRTDTGAGREATPEPPPEPPVPHIRIRDGKPAGGVERLAFDKGETVEFKVTSDVADHVHVHGYDLMKDVTPGKTVTFRFKGDIDGQFEIELEDRVEQIATLRVGP
jgi:hypothetical protein